MANRKKEHIKGNHVQFYLNDQHYKILGKLSEHYGESVNQSARMIVLNKVLTYGTVQTPANGKAKVSK